MEEKIKARLEQAVTSHVFQGCVVGVIDTLEKRTIVPIGSFTDDEGVSLITDESIFDVASVTKAIPVSSLALHLIDNSELSLHRPIVEILPELQTNHRDEVTIWHLLTQTLAFRTSLASLKEESPEMILQNILTTQFDTPPGQVSNYTNASSILLGMVIERVTGKKLDEIADAVFFKPMGMKDTSFHPETLPISRIVPTEQDPWRNRILRGEVHDESAYRLRELLVPGSAGLFTTVPDLLTFLQMLLQKGILDGKRYFSEEMITTIGENQLEEIGAVGALGWELNKPSYMGTHTSDRTIGKTGFTGCVVIADLEKGKGLIFLSNYHFPTRRARGAVDLNEVRRDISDIVFGQV